jgi:hypothetical protein
MTQYPTRRWLFREQLAGASAEKDSKGGSTPAGLTARRARIDHDGRWVPGLDPGTPTRQES